MAKRKIADLTAGEKVAGTVFFVLYLLVLPLAADPVLDLVERGLDIRLSPAARTAVCYYLLFAATVVIFHGFLGRTCHRFAQNLGEACRTAAMGLVGLYGLNELIYRLGAALAGGRTNLNDAAISAQMLDAPRMTAVVVVLLAPFVEEVLFRGLVFGALRGKSRWVAYGVSCGLFALMHVWQIALERQDAAYLWLVIQYLAPGAVLCWAYDHSGTLWPSVMVHVAANALSVWAMV